MMVVIIVVSTMLMVVVMIVLMIILCFLPDYLDCEDTTLAFAVYHASQANSFPVDVLQV
jgi:hypothetical protein